MTLGVLHYPHFYLRRRTRELKFCFNTLGYTVNIKLIRVISNYSKLSVLLLLAYASITLAAEYSAVVPLKKVAEEFNDAGAQFLLGQMYEYGQSVRQDKQAAAKWYQKAVSQNHEQAQYFLGRMYLYGDGVDKNIDSAIDLLGKAAKENENASFELGNIYSGGEYGKKDYSKALVYYEQAARMRHAAARLNLARMYRNGWGVKLDLKKWMHFLTRAAEANDKEAQYELALAYHNGLSVKKNYPLAVRWYTLSAAQAYHKAEYALGMLYAKGMEIDPDYQKALAYLSRARDGGIEPARQQIEWLRDAQKNAIGTLVE